MHIKHIHELIEKLSECACSELSSGIENVNTCEMGQVIDMIKDLAEYCKTYAAKYDFIMMHKGEK